MPDFKKRLDKVQAAMAEQEVDLLFLPPSANLSYLTTVPREEQNFGNTMYPGDWLTGAWIPQEGAPILTVPRMMAAFHLDVDSLGFDVRVLPDAGDPLELMRDVLQSLGVPANARMGVHERGWSEGVLGLQKLLPEASYTLAGTIMTPIRMIKDEEEIAIMRRAGEITEAAYEATLGKLKHGMTTLDLITEVNYQLKRHGATTNSFVTAFYNMGKNFPFDFHNREEVQLIPLDAPVSVSFDFGAVYEEYCYDYGRSVFFGEPDAEYRRVYELVMTSQAAGIAALREGNTCEDANAAARAVIDDAGYGEAFRHRLGHGIGKDVHEPPFLTQGDTTPLREGMCFTAEPSIFIPHHLGARVEDVVVVRPDSGEPLTTGYQELRVIE